MYFPWLPLLMFPTISITAEART